MQMPKEESNFGLRSLVRRTRPFRRLGKTALLPSHASVGREAKEGARGGTMGSPARLPGG